LKHQDISGFEVFILRVFVLDVVQVEHGTGELAWDI
jgi:hypothetical protein